MVIKRSSGNLSKKRRGYRKKRWYFSAGAKLPFIGKTNIAFGSSPKKQKRAMWSIAKRAVRSMTIPKEFIGTRLVAPSGVGYVYGDIYEKNILSDITNGGHDHEKLGDYIYLKNLYMTGTYSDANSSEGEIGVPKQWRLMVIKHREYFDSAVNTFGVNNFQFTDIFEVTTSNSQNVYSPHDSQQCTVLMDRLLEINTPSTLESNQKFFKFNIPMNCRFTFDEATETKGRFHNYYIVAIPFGLGLGGSQLDDLNLEIHWKVNWADTK